MKLRFEDSSGLKSVFEKLRFRDGLELDGRPNHGNKVAFLNSPSLKSSAFVTD